MFDALKNRNYQRIKKLIWISTSNTTIRIEMMMLYEIFEGNLQFWRLGSSHLSTWTWTAFSRLRQVQKMGRSEPAMTARSLKPKMIMAVFLHWKLQALFTDFLWWSRTLDFALSTNLAHLDSRLGHFPCWRISSILIFDGRIHLPSCCKLRRY